MTHTYLVYETSGRVKTISRSAPMQLSELQAIVGGYIEFVQDGAYHLCVDEEGHLRGLPWNPAYPQLVGPVIKGRMQPSPDGDVFIGAGTRVAPMHWDYGAGSAPCGARTQRRLSKDEAAVTCKNCQRIIGAQPAQPANSSEVR